MASGASGGEASGASGGKQSFFSKVVNSDPRRNPCFRQSLMSGIGAGGLLFAHRLFTLSRRPGGLGGGSALVRCVDYFMLGFLSVGSVQYGMCRYRVNEQHRILKVGGCMNREKRCMHSMCCRGGRRGRIVSAVCLRSDGLWLRRACRFELAFGHGSLTKRCVCTHAPGNRDEHGEAQSEEGRASRTRGSQGGEDMIIGVVRAESTNRFVCPEQGRPL